MAEKEAPVQDYNSGNYAQFTPDPNSRIRDIEEKQKLLKDRILLLGQTLIDERDKTFDEMQDLKKELLKLKAENLRLSEFVKRIIEKTEQSARKEELMILQRQLDILRGRK